MPNFTRYRTVEEILNGAAVECGLAPSSDAFGSTDSSFIQLRYLLLNCGLELIGRYPWQVLRREATITVAGGGTATFALPDDFDRILDQTLWDRTQDESLIGPLSAQDWQALKGLAVVPSLGVYWRLDGDKIKIFPDPPESNADFRYEYVSKSWVLDGDGVTYRDYLDGADDKILFEPMLIIKMLAYKFLSAKGFDTTSMAAQYEAAYDLAVNKNSPGTVLSLSPIDRVSLQPWSGAINNGLPA